ncbi:MAG: hypothetical protein QXI91_03810 [Candidatus Bathyarchaeia archaeon]
MPKNRHPKTKAKIKAEKEKRKGVTLFLAIVLLGISLLTYFAYTLITNPSKPSLIEPDWQLNPSAQFKAAIIDHLSLTFPNTTFVETAADLLVSANYTVDYFSGEKVTVEFYRSLPTRNYNIIILRVHSALREGTTFLALFTSEPYSSDKYFYEQLKNRVGRVRYHAGGDTYFGISHEFILSDMKGKFQNTTIIMMGCKGLEYTPIAEAFISKGAKAYIGWNASISASRTDTATTRLLHYLIKEKQTIKQAIENTMKDVGPDPTDNSTLLYYPASAGKEKIEAIP